ncbi:MAG: thiolase family protein [Myxococcota bacterium]|nr:thiolase family protein [Myxococcota bacterium]
MHHEVSLARNPLHEVAIVGAYNTPQAKKLVGFTEPALLLDAMNGTLADAGLRAEDVDGVNASTWVTQFHSRHAAMMLGARPMWTGAEYGIAGLMEAVSAVATGQCHTALVASVQCGEYTNRESTVSWTRPSNEFVECWGLYTAAEFALIARRHMHLYGTPQEALAEIAAAIRMNGARNPEAVMYGKDVIPEHVLKSRMVADPFHLLDCCINSEGGAGLLITTAERARDLDVQPIYVLGGAMDRQGMSYVTAPVWDKYGLVGRRAAQLAFDQCGLTPRDVDVLELYDPFSFEIIRQLEAFGFCGEGEGGDYVLEGNVRIDGATPVATNGGLLSFSHAGVAQLLQKPIAAVHQLRGDLPAELTVPEAKVAIASNGGAGALFNDVMLLGVEQP